MSEERTTVSARAPVLNTFDLVEQMPGAQSSANPAQREEFEQRCKKLYNEERQDEGYAAARAPAAAGSKMEVSDMQAMFPSLDADLVRMLCAEAPSPEHALNTLLALAASMGDPGPPGPTVPAPDIGVDDADKFPCLMDGDGWQVPGTRANLASETEEPTNAWRDRAKAAAALPSPQRPAPAPKAARRGPAVPKKSNDAQQVDGAEYCTELETDFEFRQRRGERRARNIAKARKAPSSQAAKAGSPIRPPDELAEDCQSLDDDEEAS